MFVGGGNIDDRLLEWKVEGEVVGLLSVKDGISMFFKEVC